MKQKRRRVTLREHLRINIDYRFNQLSYAELCKKYNRPLSTICNHIDEARSITDGMNLHWQKRRDGTSRATLDQPPTGR
jgi:hypothetical protein